MIMRTTARTIVEKATPESLDQEFPLTRDLLPGFTAGAAGNPPLAPRGSVAPPCNPQLLVELPLEREPLLLNLTEWLYKHFAHPWHLKKYPIPHYQDKYDDLAHEALLMTLPPDGYDITAHSLTLDGRLESAEAFKHDARSFWSTFFGLPNRLDKNRKYDFTQFLKNLIGGWDWDKETSPIKKLLQVVGLLLGIKSILIPAFNLAGMLVKTLLNHAKIVTELLPSLGANHTALTITYLLRQSETDRSGLTPAKIKTIKILYWAGIIPLGILHYLLRALAIFGRTITSPGKSVKMAWDYSRELKGKKGYVIGAVAVTLSLMLSVTVWAILLPFTIHFIPASASAWVSQLPGIGPIFAAIKAAFLSVGQFLGPLFRPVFGPAISGISVVFGSGPSGLSILLGIGLSTIGTPIIAFGSLLAEKASNAWAKAWTGLDKWLKAIFNGPDSTDEQKSRKSRSASYSFENAGGSTPASASLPTLPSSPGTTTKESAENLKHSAKASNDIDPNSSNRFALFTESLKKSTTPELQNSPENAEVHAYTSPGFDRKE
jgi:hypothetical protein